MRRHLRTALGSTVTLPTPLVVVLVLLLGATGSATAARLVTGAQIKDGTVTTADVKDRTLTLADVAPKARQQLEGRRGPAGLSSLSALPRGAFVVGGGGLGSYDTAGSVIDAVTALGIRTTRRIKDAGAGRNVWFGAPFGSVRDDAQNAGACAGTAAAPTAARGQLCLYLLSVGNLADDTVLVDAGVSIDPDPAEFGNVVVRGTVASDGHAVLRFVWAYTAP